MKTTSFNFFHLSYRNNRVHLSTSHKSDKINVILNRTKMRELGILNLVQRHGVVLYEFADTNMFDCVEAVTKLQASLVVQNKPPGAKQWHLRNKFLSAPMTLPFMLWLIIM